MLEKDRIAMNPKQQAGMNDAISSIFTWPQALHAFADHQVVKGKETVDALNTAAQGAYSTNIKTLNEYGQKVMKAGQQDADRAYDCWREITSAKSLPELIEVWASQAPQQFEAISSRTGELLALFCRMTADTTKPITASMTHMLASSR